MSWNDGYERKKFNARIKKEIAEYKAAGMTEEQITAIVSLDEDQYTRLEIEKLEQALASCDMIQTVFSDSQIRLLVECIRVNKNNTIDIVLKGGFSITEKL